MRRPRRLWRLHLRRSFGLTKKTLKWERPERSISRRKQGE